MNCEYGNKYLTYAFRKGRSAIRPSTERVEQIAGAPHGGTSYDLLKSYT